MKRTIFIFLFLCFLFSGWSQQTDSLSTVQQDSVKNAKELRKKTYFGPRKASIMSTVLPGLGQIYNKKYWKVPIIYAGLGGFGYMFVTNNREYNFYRNNLRATTDQDENTVNTTRYNTEQLQVQKISYRKSRDFAAVGAIIIYVLNIVDANVDAHLKTFDVSDDLSLHIEPWQNIYHTETGFRSASGLSLKLNFK